MHNKNTPLDGTFQDIQTVTLTRLVPEARALLIQHGCTMRELKKEETLITFPSGTQRQTIWPRTVSEHYRILLPDGQELRQVSDRMNQGNQLFLVLASEPGVAYHKQPDILEHPPHS